MDQPGQREYGRVLESLGERPTQAAVENVLDLHRLLERGISGSAIGRLGKQYGLTNEDLRHVLGLKLRTLQRRQKQNRLPRGETDRLWRAAVLLDEANEIFGSREKTASWLRRPLRALGGARPMDMLRTEVGYAEVRNVLGRIEWGVWN